MDTAELRKMWDERYSREGLAFGDQPNDFLRSQEQRIRADIGPIRAARHEGVVRGLVCLGNLISGGERYPGHWLLLQIDAVGGL